MPSVPDVVGSFGAGRSGRSSHSGLTSPETGKLFIYILIVKYSQCNINTDGYICELSIYDSGCYTCL